MTTPLFLLRCYQLHIPASDLELFTVGFINDMFTERFNDDYDYPLLSTQEDFDKF